MLQNALENVNCNSCGADKDLKHRETQRDLGVG